MLTRRQMLSVPIVSGLGAMTQPVLSGEPRRKRPRVAAIITHMTYRSHAHVILENFLKPYLFNGKLTDPGVDVVSMYVDQFPKGRDMARGVAKDYRIPIFKTIADAMRVGRKEMSVDAVLSIGEHGSYPKTKYGQVMYPRKRFFDAIVAEMKRADRYVPIFNDKHLSYRWDWAKEMYDVAAKHRIPFLAGSSVPLAQRIPPFEMPGKAELSDAVSIHGGGPESYDFHALEVLQSQIEFRKGGETGISKVQFLTGDALWKAADQGKWSLEVATQACQREFGKRIDIRKPIGGVKPHGVLLTYKDGLRGIVLKLGGSGIRWLFGCRTKSGKIHSTRYYVGPWQNRNLFKALSHAIQTHFRTGKSPYPVERTLLATGVCDVLMRSRFHKEKAIATPELEFAYKAKDFRAMREMGATWKIITEKTPQPKGINPNGNALPR